MNIQEEPRFSSVSVEKVRSDPRCFFILMDWGLRFDTDVGISDASKQFWKYHNEGVLKKYQERLKIGEVKEEAKL